MGVGLWNWLCGRREPYNFNPVNSRVKRSNGRRKMSKESRKRNRRR